MVVLSGLTVPGEVAECERSRLQQLSVGSVQPLADRCEDQPVPVIKPDFHRLVYNIAADVWTRLADRHTQTDLERSGVQIHRQTDS